MENREQFINLAVQYINAGTAIRNKDPEAKPVIFHSNGQYDMTSKEDEIRGIVVVSGDEVSGLLQKHDSEPGKAIEELAAILYAYNPDDESRQDMSQEYEEKQLPVPQDSEMAKVHEDHAE